MTDLHLDHVSGVLFDLGVSSPQLDRAERGFSYRSAGPIDMRMDPTEAVVGRRCRQRLLPVGAGSGAARLRRRAVRRSGRRRHRGRSAHRGHPQLAEIVRTAIPAATRRKGGHPAKRTFQAIRIEVNRELEILPTALERAIAALVPRGRVAVLSYHSGEDRIVKAAFRAAATGGCVCPPGLPCVCGAVRTVRIVRPEHREPAAAERAANPRSESARLRIVERLED